MQHAERVLYAHLTSVDSLDVLALEGFSNELSREVIPKETGRKIVAWALDYYFANGRKVAPSREAIVETWGDDMEAVEIEIDDDTETDSVEWAIEALRANYGRWRSEQLVKESAQAIAGADPTGIVEEVLGTAASFYLLAQSLISRKQESLAGPGLEESLRRHGEIAEAGQSIQGMTFGLPLLDEHLLGLHDGELGIMAAFSGVGKSWMTLKPMLAEWKRGRRCVLFTLENDLDMTFDRIACAGAKVNYERWQRGEAEEGEIERVTRLAAKLKESEHAPIVIMPQAGECDPVSLVRKARLLGADSMIVDQISHVEPVPGSRRTKRHEEVADIVSAFSREIKGSEALPCLLVSQIKREGHDRARKSGFYVMDDMAETSRIERDATLIMAIYQSEVMRAAHTAQLQELKFRRGKTKNWDMAFRLEVGDIRVLREAEVDDV